METTTLDRTPTTDAEYEAAIDQMMMQMQQMRASMAETQRRTEILQAETRLKMAEFQRVLARLEAS